MDELVLILLFTFFYTKLWKPYLIIYDPFQKIVETK